MARLASESKGGYYPTPPEEMAHVCRRLMADSGAAVNIYDPCCGKGAALYQVAQHLRKLGASVTTYGTELEEERAREAKKVLDHVVWDGYENMRMTRNSTGFLWLNPPYNFQNGQRTEVVFLRFMTRPDGPLAPGGVLGYCIPQSVLRDAATLIATRFADIEVFRFTDNNFNRFHQVVVLGRRREKAVLVDPRIISKTKEWLYSLSVSDPRYLCRLDRTYDKEQIYNIPETQPVTLFKGSKISSDQFLDVITRSQAWDAVREMHHIEEAVLKPPLLPYKVCHLATVMAAGMASWPMGNHIITGGTKIVDDIEQTVDKKGRAVEVKTERPISVVRLFSPKWGVQTLS